MSEPKYLTSKGKAMNYQKVLYIIGSQIEEKERELKDLKETLSTLQELRESWNENR